MGCGPLQGEGQSGAIRDHDRARLGGLQQRAARHGAGAGGRELLRSAEHDLPVRRLYLRRRRRCRHRRDQDPPLLCTRRLRYAHQPDDHRGADPRRPDRSFRHRDGAGDPLRRRGQRHHRVADGLFPPDRGRDAALGNRLDYHALTASSDRRQGRGRKPECRRGAVFCKRHQRCVRVSREHAHRDAARSLAHLDGGGEARAAWMNREAISDQLAAAGYIADRDIATALWLMEFLKRPLLLEGEAGVGKTEVAKALAAVHGAELIRLQCYEGLDQNAALYEWNYQRQLLAIKTREGVGENAEALDWAATLAGLELHDLRQEPEAVHETMMCLLKTHEDRSRVTREVTERL